MIFTHLHKLGPSHHRYSATSRVAVLVNKGTSTASKRGPRLDQDKSS